MEIIFLAVGLLTGIFTGWLLAGFMQSKKRKEGEFNLMMLREKNTGLVEEVEKQKEEAKENALQIIDLNKSLSTRTAQLENLENKLSEQKQEIEKVQEKFRMEFRNLANEILEEKSSKFTLQNKVNIAEILKPLGEKIKDFEKKVEDTYDKGVKNQTDLKAELKKVFELSQRLDEDARNLTNALRSDSKKQGNWGEIVLERVLERSGLVKGSEYETQASFRNEQGELIRPDVLVHLPGNKSIIIDSKVSLNAYERYISEDEAEKKDRLLKLHIDSIRAHIKGLGDKNYQLAGGLDTPDFVLLFMPIESAFSLAVQNDPELFAFAWDRRIVIVSPTTLLATLRTVESIWKHEKQTQNAIEIARQGGALYDKFVSFLEDLERIGSQLSTLQKTYENAHKKISSGTGNLITRADKLKKLGAKASKELPNSLLEANHEDTE